MRISKRFRPALLFVAGVAVGGLLLTPAGAHAGKRFGHLWKEHIKPKLAAQGTVNASKNPVDWTRLKKVPAQFADGTDDVASGAGGGGITGVTAGTGLVGGGASGNVSLSVDPAVVQTRIGQDCRPDGAVTEIRQDGTVACTDAGWRGEEWVFEQSAQNSNSRKVVLARCPQGKTLIGGGASVESSADEFNFAPDQVALQRSQPQLQTGDWIGEGVEVAATPDPWRVNAWALCAITGG